MNNDNVNDSRAASSATLKADEMDTAMDEKLRLPAALAAGDVPGDEEKQLTRNTDYEVKFDGLEDPLNPRGMTKWKKWVITLIVSSCSLCVTCSSSIYTSTYTQLKADFHCSETVAILGLSLFVFGLGLGPMFLAPLSEFYGRRPIYIVSFGCYVLFIIPQAVAQNMQTMLVARFLDGVAGSAFLSVSGGTVSDMFSGPELGLPMMFFTASPFLGPEVGPLVGGFVNQYANWRWTFYIMLIWSAVLFCALLFTSETYNPVMLKKKAAVMRAETGDDKFYAPIERQEKSISRTIARSCLRPFQLLLFEPIVLLLCSFTSLLLGILYLFFEAFPLVFENNHDFKLSQVGMSFLGLGVGMVAAVLTDPLWRKTFVKLVEKRGGEAIPEFRLPPAMLGGVLVPVGTFWFAFTQYRSVHWIVPIIGSTFFAFGMLLVFSGVFTFLVAAYPAYAASALAANSFMRSCFAAGFPLFANAMYHKLGFAWATALLAFLTLVMAPFPFIFFKYGERLRAHSSYT